jgi:hypothetical protein
MGLSRYASTHPYYKTGRVTPSRQHVTPHALRPRLLHAAEEAASGHGPEQAAAVTAYESDFCSAASHGILGVLLASWVHRRLYSYALLLLYSVA